MSKMEKPLFKIGDEISFRDSYWGKMEGVIDMIGTQGDKYIYRVSLKNGNSTACKEKNVTHVNGMTVRKYLKEIA